MNGFWNDTFCDPAVFWSFVEAISTFAALIVIAWQIPKIRSELVGEKLGRLIYALDLLSSEDFVKTWESFEYITSKWSPRAWEGKKLGAVLYGLLKPIDLIAKLIEQKQIVQEELFKAEGTMLANLRNKIDQLDFEGNEQAFFTDILGTYHKGLDLLSEADKWKKKKLPRL